MWHENITLKYRINFKYISNLENIATEDEYLITHHLIIFHMKLWIKSFETSISFRLSRILTGKIKTCNSIFLNLSFVNKTNGLFIKI